MSLNIGYFYPDLLNLYGDNGNVEILVSRATQMKIKVNVFKMSVGDAIPKELNLVFMGGGPDADQKAMFTDLVKNKAHFLQNYINEGGVGLFICGAYQLLGRHYKASDGSVLQGLGIFDVYTEHFGPKKPRCIGNTVARLNPMVANDTCFNKESDFKDIIVGFENHGGRTYLGNKAQSLATVIKGRGNNSEDGTEGIIQKNALGSYFHGPFLAKNPHVADFLIFKSLGLSQDKIVKLPKINDSLMLAAHTASKNIIR